MTSGGSLSIPDLRARIKGEVIAPDDPGYDDARSVFYGGIDHRPAAIVRVADAEDVACSIEVARDTGSALAVRSGGHSPLGHSVTDGGIVIDLGLMRGLDIDVDGGTAWAETGLTAGEYTNAAGDHGLATGFGDTGSVGIGGITLGGGVGFLVRKHGLTIDDLLAAEVVTADGRLLRVDEDNEPDLFWALRGGGGNFGVVTRFKFRLHRVEPFVGGMLILPATSDVIAGFIAEADAAPDALSTIANVMNAPPMPFLPPDVHGRLILFAFIAYSGEVEDGQRAIAPLRALATPLADMVRPMAYREMYLPDDPDYHPTAAGRTMFVDSVDGDTAETILGFLERSDAMMRVTQLRVLGGAMARVAPDATAFSHRNGRIMANVAALYTSPEEKPAREAWVADLAAALRGQDEGAYVNFISDEGEDTVRAAYPGTTWDRLTEIKARYDPGNLFRRNINIPPRAV